MIFRLFKKKKPVHIHIQEIEPWIRKTIESKNLGLKIGIFKREINSKKVKIRELLSDLENAEIKDASVFPERAKNMFEGNKSTYIKKINGFLDSVEHPEDVSQIETFFEDISIKLEHLAQDTTKNYFIVKEFAEDEVSQVASKIKELDTIVSSAREAIEKTSIGKFKELKKLLDEYHANIELIEENKKLMEEILSRKAEELYKKRKNESKIDILKKSKYHEEYTSLKIKKEELEEELKRTEYSVINLFSGISSILKKYNKKKNNKLSESYSDNAVTALLADKDLEILIILKDMHKIKSSLDVKDSKLKTLDSDIALINETTLSKLRNNILDLKEEINDLNIRLKNHSFKLNLMEQEGRLNIIDNTIKDIEKEEQEIEEKLERLSPRLVKQKMKQVVREIDENTELI